MRKFVIPLICLLAFEADARATNVSAFNLSDTTKKASPDTAKIFSKPGTYLPAVILVAVGTSSFVITPVRNFDYYIRDRVAVSAPNYNSKLSDYLQLSPAVAVYALNLAGVEGKHRFVDRTALIALSGGILTVADGLKYIGHRDRPYANDPLSWPSGHTGAAFLAAEYLAQEYGDKSVWYSVAGYTIASTTAVLRVYGRAHWVSDCVTGAGLGILSTKVAYLIYPTIAKALTHKDKYNRSTMVLPTYQNGAPGLSIAMQL